MEIGVINEIIWRDHVSKVRIIQQRHYIKIRDVLQIIEEQHVKLNIEKVDHQQDMHIIVRCGISIGEHVNHMEIGLIEILH